MAKKPQPLLSFENDIRTAGTKDDTYAVVILEGQPEIRFMRNPKFTGDLWIPGEIDSDAAAIKTLEALVETEDYGRLVELMRAFGNRFEGDAIQRVAKHVMEECVPMDPKEPTVSDESSSDSTTKSNTDT